MPKRLICCLSALAVLMALWLLSGCAPQGFDKAMQEAARMAQQGDYKAAYDYYKKATELWPDDEDAAAKLKHLAQIVYNKEREKGVQAFEQRKYKTAIGYFETALKYQDLPEVRDLIERCRQKLSDIQKDYNKVDKLIAEGQWIDGVNLLIQILNRYADDPELAQRIETTKDMGYKSYYSKGLEQRKEGRYADSLHSMQSANSLRPGETIRREIEKAKAYVRAGQLAGIAAKKREAGDLLAAMDLLLQAKALASDHIQVVRMIEDILPQWSEAIYLHGIEQQQQGLLQQAYVSMKKLIDLNPGYQGAESAFMEISLAYLKQLYRYQIAASNSGDLAGVLEYGGRIKEIDPTFIDSLDQIASAPLAAFNRYYQMGHFYGETGEFGKAILCFRSAETFIGKNGLTKGLIEEAQDSLRKASERHIFIWDFSEQVGDPSIADYATGRLKASLASCIRKTPLENIKLDFSNLSRSQRISQKLLANDIDWGLIRAKNCNTIIACDIQLLKIDKSLQTEWKTRERKVRKIVDNEEFAHLQMEMADLKKKLRIDGYPNKGKMEDRIERIQKDLEVISPKIEREILEKTSYQVETHTLKAYIQIQVDILDKSGSSFWPEKQYEATYEITDDVIPPDLNSKNAKERKGDPLFLPTESKFKEQAIDFILEKNIIPDVMKAFENYGMRYLKKAESRLSRSKAKTDSRAELREAVEDYFTFLSCYKDKGPKDGLTEEVERKLDELIVVQWLLKRSELVE